MSSALKQLAASWGGGDVKEKKFKELTANFGKSSEGTHSALWRAIQHGGQCSPEVEDGSQGRRRLGGEVESVCVSGYEQSPVPRGGRIDC